MDMVTFANTLLAGPYMVRVNCECGRYLRYEPRTESGIPTTGLCHLCKSKKMDEARMLGVRLALDATYSAMGREKRA